jgi:hypothetical protein
VLYKKEVKIVVQKSEEFSLYLVLVTFEPIFGQTLHAYVRHVYALSRFTRTFASVFVQS